LGSKYAVVAGGGTIYTLVLVAGLQLRVALGEMSSRTAWELGKLLRQPDLGTTVFLHPSQSCSDFLSDTPTGRLIAEKIIPSINVLRQTFHLSIATLFSPSFLQANGVDGNVLCGDLTGSDRFFDSIRIK
jgi:hypothetical protein